VPAQQKVEAMPDFSEHSAVVGHRLKWVTVTVPLEIAAGRKQLAEIEAEEANSEASGF
jgi:hypothetical protein